jgi:hypothetical protein
MLLTTKLDRRQMTDPLTHHSLDHGVMDRLNLYRGDTLCQTLSLT